MKPLRVISGMLLTVSALQGWGQSAGTKPKLGDNPSPMQEAPLTPRERAEQVLNRFTYGPRPGDVDRVMSQGADAWLEQQMTPEKIDDSALERRLGDLPTIRMNPEQVLTCFPTQTILKEVVEGKRPFPVDPLLISVYEVQLYKLKADKEKKSASHVEPTDAEKEVAKKADQATAARIAGELSALPKTDRMAAFNKMPVADRIAFANYVPGDQKKTLVREFTGRERETVQAMQGGGVGSPRTISDEFQQAHVLREVLSERQLQEVMTDFWFNHFNVFMSKDADQWYTPTYERESIRPHALGKFRDLLLATAESPAMMIYLDNWLSIGPRSMANAANPKSNKDDKGLNENYGREVMELHTLGVNGGYSQADVTQLSAILTGWSVDRPLEGGPFFFEMNKHEPGTKTWFGYSIDEQGDVKWAPGSAAGRGHDQVPSIKLNPGEPGGMRQGVAALCLLAAAPQTAHFVSYLLAQRFIADEPPPALVERMAKSYLSSDGDIRVVLRTLESSPEFNSRQYFRNKVKTPQEFLASAFRATATDPSNPAAMVEKLRVQGQQPYQKPEPTGYYITADHWMSSGALLDRLNIADQLTHNKFADQKFDSGHLLALGLEAKHGPSGGRSKEHVETDSSSGDVRSDAALQALEETLIGAPLSAKTDRFVRAQMAAVANGDPTETLNLLTALLIGSPEFQVR